MTEKAPFVGRKNELTHLLTALGGDAHLVLVVGDAGVGKSRFAEEGMTRATAMGTVVARGECLPLAGMLPLLPVTSALAELGRLRTGRVMESALQVAPGFVREEVGRLLPQVAAGDGETGSLERGEEWRRGRLFAAVAELLAAIADEARFGLVLLVEDVQWADSETLDFLTFLSRARPRDTVHVVVTCRSDEVPLGAEVVRWLAQVRGAAGVEEIRLGPLSRAEVAQQVAALVGETVASDLADELFMRAEGNPFFTEQLVAAALAADAEGGSLRVPVVLPARLADVLVARAARCAGDAQAMLNAMAVAGRPMSEDLLGAVTGLAVEAVRRGLQELATARLLADEAPGGGHRPSNSLLAEAVAGGLLAGERAGLHESIAHALAAGDGALAAGDRALAAEAARHWQAAGRPAAEAAARVPAAMFAERVFGFAEAAGHWQRAIELWPAVPDAAVALGIDLPGIYVHAIDALQLSGDEVHAAGLAEEAYRQFADDRDPSIAAIACHRAAFFRSINTPTTGRPLLEQALRLFEQAPPSASHAAARYDYALSFLHSADRGRQATLQTLLNQALEIAEAAGATSLTPSILNVMAYEAFLSGRVEEGRAGLDRGRTLAEATQDGLALLRLAVADSDTRLKLAHFNDAVEVASRGLASARRAGLEASFEAGLSAANAAEALVALGRTGEAGALIDPLTIRPPDLGAWVVHEARVEIDLLRGDIEAADRRRQQIKACVGELSHVESARESALRSAELALWDRRPDAALNEVQQVLGLFPGPDLTILCGRLLATGMWACADIAEQARARRHPSAGEPALVAADGLVSWVRGMGDAPFIDHPFVATIPAERATWEAERTRLSGASDPGTWATAAKLWDGLGCPHRVGYALWRQTQAQLDAGQTVSEAAATLGAAAAAADGHQPLLAQIRALAERARIHLATPAVATPSNLPPDETRTRLGLTGREVAVLRLLAAGRTNAQIGAELYISPRTAGVHVTNILRKLGVSGRVQAAAVAERAGLLKTRHP